ncbi:helix-turn-helix domain-containing protein [Sphingobium olei]|uniref:Helix-turn-helix domain-containing protein n=1 Tax=Sphingobium olei TaxID=420955 RepID=A0ABW3P2T8_9SPHN
MVAKADLLGRKFGELTVIAEAQSDASGKAKWLCSCSCGAEKAVAAASLLRGLTRSCGAQKHRAPNVIHGHAHAKAQTGEYKSWAAIIQRCTNPNNPGYAAYGGAGIDVCERWRSFSNFLEDMGPKPTKFHSIDRLDNSRGYHPDNCRWATKREQVLNRAYTKLSDALAIMVRESKRSHGALAKELGVSKSTIAAIRSGRNWSDVS